MDEELQRRFVAVEQAEKAWRDHRRTGFEVGYVGGPTIGTASADPLAPEWREQEAQLWSAFAAARQAWASYRPRQ